MKNHRSQKVQLTSQNVEISERAFVCSKWRALPIQEKIRLNKLRVTDYEEYMRQTEA